MTTKIDTLVVDTAVLNFTQTPTIPTETAGNRSSSIANTAFIQNDFSIFVKPPNISVTGVKTFTGTQTVSNLNGGGTLTISDGGVSSTLVLGVAGGNILMNTLNQGFNSTWKYLISSLSTASTTNPCIIIQTGSFNWTTGSNTLTFPQPFPFTPTVVVCQAGGSVNSSWSIQGPTTISVNVRSNSTISTTINWLAISS